MTDHLMSQTEQEIDRLLLEVPLAGPPDLFDQGREERRKTIVDQINQTWADRKVRFWPERLALADRTPSGAARIMADTGTRHYRQVECWDGREWRSELMWSEAVELSEAATAAQYRPSDLDGRNSPYRLMGNR